MTSIVGYTYLVLAAGLVLGWLYNLRINAGKHHKKLPVAIHILWVTVAIVYIFFGTEMT
jgi:hypothetical protein